MQLDWFDLTVANICFTDSADALPVKLGLQLLNQHQKLVILLFMTMF